MLEPPPRRKNVELEARAIVREDKSSFLFFGIRKSFALPPILKVVFEAKGSFSLNSIFILFSSAFNNSRFINIV